MDLNSRHVFLTGGSRGIGLAVAGALVARGARVFIAALDEPADLAAACASIDPTGQHTAWRTTDVTSESSVSAALTEAESTFGAIDLLVNNAGMAVQETVVDVEVARVRRELETNYLGAFLTSKLALPAMIARGAGTIVNVASTLALVPGPTLAGYSASKAAVLAFSSALLGEVEEHGIDVRVFVPGLTDTGLTDSLHLDTGTLATADEVARDFLAALDGDGHVFVCGDVNRMLADLAHTDPDGARTLMKDSILPQFKRARSACPERNHP